MIDFYGTCSDAFAGCAGQIDSFTSQHRGKTGAAYVVALALLLQDKYQAAFDYVTTNDGWGIADLEWYFGYQNGISLDNASRLIGDVSVDFAGSGGDPRDEDGLADLAIAIGPYKSLQAIRHHLVPDAIGRREAGNLGYNYRQAPCCQVPTAADHLRISNRLNPVVADLKAGRILNRPGSGGGSGYWFPTLIGVVCWAA